MADAPVGFGGGLGQVIGGVMANNELQNTQSAVNDSVGNFKAGTAPYNTFGQSFMPGAAAGIGNVVGAANTTQGYNQFMSTYTNTPAAQYQLEQADAVQNSSAASKGSLLSGANERALGTINSGIVAQNANTAYDQYLKGNNQQFGQLETALGNMFSAIGIGQTATGQQAGVTNAGIGATSNIGQAEAKNDQSKGSGIGSMFGGLGSLGFAF